LLNPFKNMHTMDRHILVSLVVSFAVKSCVFVLAAPYGGDFPPQGLTMPAPLQTLEAYKDFRFYYLPQAIDFASGLMPYRDFFYSYPPLFLRVLVMFSQLPLPEWKFGLPLMMFDALSVIPLYFIVRKLTDKKKAFVASILYALAPINLFYDDFLWLNPPPTTFFTLLAVYFLLEKRYKTSSLMLALATLTKQTSVILFPVLFLITKNRVSMKRALTYALTFISVCFIGSLPYIVFFPQLYLWSIRFPGVPVPTPLPDYMAGWPQPSNATTPQPVTYYAGHPTNLAIPLQLLGFWEAYWFANNSLGVILVFSYGLLLWRVHRNREISDEGVVAYSLLAFLVFYSFYSRGIYKYYFASVTPLLASLAKGKRQIYAFIAFNVLVLFIPRYLTPLPALITLVWMIRKSLLKTASFRFLTFKRKV